MYPFPKETLRKICNQYENVKEYVWVQEEPENMGAWSYILRIWPYSKKVHLVSRPTLAAPATGSNKQHHLEQKQVVESAFGKL